MRAVIHDIVQKLVKRREIGYVLALATLALGASGCGLRQGCGAV